jgi:phosphomannomutase
MGVEVIAKRYRSTVLRSRVGEAHVAQLLLEREGVIGGEGNGGVLYPALPPLDKRHHETIRGRSPSGSRNCRRSSW